MANHAGSEGTVKIGSNTIAEIRSFSIDESHDAIEKKPQWAIVIVRSQLV